MTVWDEIAPRDGQGGFTPAEFSDPDAMDPDFLRLLYRMRLAAGVPFRVISSARDPEGTVGATLSAHKKRPCRAVDLQVMNNYERFRILRTAVLHGIERIGIYPASSISGKGGVHLDAEPSLPAERCWTRY